MKISGVEQCISKIILAKVIFQAYITSFGIMLTFYGTLQPF